MGVKIQAACALALLQSCSLVSDFDFREGDGGTGRDSAADVVTTDSGDASDTWNEAGLMDVSAPEDAPASPLELTGLVLVADEETVSFNIPFDPSDHTYDDGQVGFFVREVNVTATTEAVGATLTVDGVTITSGEPTPVELAFGDNVLQIELTRGAEAAVTYTLAVDRGDSLMTPDYLKSNPVALRADFGGAVAMAGNVLVVGAPQEPRGASLRVGAAYIFEHDGSRWIQTDRVERSLPQADMFFGFAVATDGVSIAVGAPGDTGEFAEGAVYVYRKAGASWTQSDRVTTAPLTGDQFGFSVAIEGNRLAVGADGRNTVFTFTTGDTIWIPRQTIMPPAGVSSASRFGSALVMRGDTLVIAADGEDSGVAGGVGGVNPVLEGTLSGSGAVFVYTHDGSGWTDPTSFKAFGPLASDRFGSAIAFDGDLLAVGAADEDSNAVGIRSEDAPDGDSDDSGAVYTFHRDAAGVWTSESYFKAEVPETSAGYGSSVALWGNLLVVGSPDAAGAGTLTGIASRYVRSGGSWSYSSTLQPDGDADFNDSFGGSVGISGFGIVVGATGEDGDGSFPSNNDVTSAGAAYSFFEP